MMMTYEQVIAVFKNMIRSNNEHGNTLLSIGEVQALEMAIEALKGKDIDVPSRKGVFIPDITVEMFRNASLEGVEELMASGVMEDVSLPSAQPEWNNHTVACLLADLFNDTCACNYNGIDEWLPEKCEVIDSCPHPVGVECWEQVLKHRKERRTDG